VLCPEPLKGSDGSPPDGSQKSLPKDSLPASGAPVCGPRSSPATNPSRYPILPSEASNLNNRTGVAGEHLTWVRFALTLNTTPPFSSVGQEGANKVGVSGAERSCK